MSASSDPLPTIEEPPYLPVRYIAGFWRRFFAFAIDSLILSAICFPIALFLSDYFHYHRQVAALVGFLIVVPYFAILSSGEAGGQTLGMRAMSIEVVDRQGERLPLGRSFIRSLILLAPMIGGAELLPHGTPWAIQEIVGYTLSVLGLTFTYLAVFNTATRQSIHDLMTGAFVTDEAPDGQVGIRPFWTGHWKILAGIVAASMIAGYFIDRIGNSSSTTLGKLMKTVNVIRVLPNVDQASVYSESKWRNGQATEGVQVIVRYNDRPADLETSAAAIVDVVLRNDPDAIRGDYISVVSDEGFRVGFATLKNKSQISHTPAEWQNLITAQANSKGQF